MNKFELLGLLGGGGYISGEVIAGKFGVTRAAVWKAVADLRGDGYKIESRTNNGYRLASAFDVLNAHEIKSRLAGLDFEVIYKKATGSTNDDAKKITGGHNVIVAAGELSAARGRYGRGFSAGPGGAYFTLRIGRPDNFFNLDGLTFYPLIAAAATARAVFELCGIDLCIKWPNDLLYKSPGGYRKAVGILTEASIQAESRDICYVIAGIGVNVNTGGFDGELKDTATSLKLITGQDYSRADLICAIVRNFMQFAHSSREHLLGEYKKRLLSGVRVSFAQNGREYTGVARDINSSGNLLAEVDGAVITVQSGEISLIK